MPFKKNNKINLGKKWTEEHRVNYIKARTGHKASEETRGKLRLSHLGKPGYWKGKKRPDISKLLKDRELSEETKEKIRKANLGKKYSNETKEKHRKFALENNFGKHLPRLCGDKHPNWRGGYSKKGYTQEWKETLRRAIRERDNYTCKIYGSIQGDITFDVHHIDYDKKNCNPNNFVTLCHSCHAKTNHHREEWMERFKKLFDLKHSE